MVYGKDSRDLKYRSNWNAPVAVSPHDPSIIYYGTQLVLRSTDRGTWTEISPDLTRNDPEKQGRNGGPLTPENVGAEFYNTIFYIVESPHEENLVWAGSDDGLVHLTPRRRRQLGKCLPQPSGRSDDQCHRNQPPRPGHGIPCSHRLQAERLPNPTSTRPATTANTGSASMRACHRMLLYASCAKIQHTRACCMRAPNSACSSRSTTAETGNPSKLNLPPVPITDLSLRHDKLVAATQGRGFWVLDDLFVVRQAAGGFSGKPLHAVYTGHGRELIPSSGKAGAFEGANPEPGVPLYYYPGRRDRRATHHRDTRWRRQSRA